MLNHLTNMWPCVLLCCASCTLDSSPRFPSTAGESEDKDARGEWQPAEADAARVSASTRAAKDAEAIEDETMPAPAANPSRPTSNAGDPGSAAGMARATTPSGMSVPAAGSGASPTQPTPAAGSGGAGGVAGSAGSAGAESDSVRQRLIDAASGTLGGTGTEPWRTGSRDGGLNADFVKSVLFSMRTSGQCFRDVRRCIETCVVISQDCKPCAQDPECAAALQEVCGDALGTCTP